MTEICIKDSSETFDCDADDTILRAALRAGHGMMYSCNVGSCGNCKFELVEGQVTHLRADAPAWSEKDLKRNRWLGCQARPDGPCTVKFKAQADYIPQHQPIRRTAVLHGITPITHDIHEFRFAIEGNDRFLPGQYALLSIDGVEGQRAYSMCNLPGEGSWGFQIKKVPGGKATERLFALSSGAEVKLDGPYGTAFLQDSPRDIVLLAGGSGLSPMVSIARGALSNPGMAKQNLHFYYGCRGEADMIAPDLIGQDFADKVTFTTALSVQPSAGSESRQGFLHNVVQADFEHRLKDCEIYFAGPPLMSSAIQKMAYELGVPAEQLHFDEFY